MKGSITWSALGALGGVLTSSVGGSWYVSSAIAEEGRRARTEAKELVLENRQRADEVYASRADVLVLQTKLDAMLAMQKEILIRLREQDMR